MKTHNSGQCRFHERESKIKNESNKETSNYCFYHDSGTSKTMINFEPTNKIIRNSSIYTAGKNQPPEQGISIGQIPFNGLSINAIQVPTFSKNLLSATQLSIEHGCKQVIEPWTAKLIISKDGKTVATGTYDEDVKLIKIEPNQELACTATETWKTVHRKLGHAGNKLIKNTMRASTGITISENKFAAIECEDCLTTKAKRGAISKGSTLKKKEIAEVIEIDVQGPFPTVANDGTHSNLKLIGSQSGWFVSS